MVAAQALSADGKPYRLHVTRDLTGSKEILNGYRVKVDTIVLAGGLCVGLIRCFVARRGVQLLAALVQAIAREGGGSNRRVTIDGL